MVVIMRHAVYNYNRQCLRMNGDTMEYMSCAEAAGKWGISERRVQKLCEGNRIQGVVKFGQVWLIPKNAKKPVDMRLKRNLGKS